MIAAALGALLLAATPAGPGAGEAPFAAAAAVPVSAVVPAPAAVPASAAVPAPAGVPASAVVHAPAGVPAQPPRALAFRPHVRFAADTPVAAPRRRDEGPDRWIAPDKLKHFLMSYAVTVVGYAFARTAGLGHSGALVAGTGAGAAAGVWKEARDRLTGGDVSARDLVWDAVGVATGGVIAAQTR